jgi:hypothetical protein
MFRFLIVCLVGVTYRYGVEFIFWTAPREECFVLCIRLEILVFKTHHSGIHGTQRGFLGLFRAHLECNEQEMRQATKTPF